MTIEHASLHRLNHIRTQAAYFLLIALFLGSAFETIAAQTDIEAWGTTLDGRPVEKVYQTNDVGMRLSYIDYGATITSIDVPDRCGKSQNIVLSLPDIAAYQRTKRRFAAVMGRYAGRIANARFTLDQRVIELVPTLNGYALHGDPTGYDRRVWQRNDFADTASIGSVFQLVSDDGDQQFPGRLNVRVTYRLYRTSKEFRIEYEARSDAPTVINLTNHAYFNLAGAGTPGLDSHTFHILADRYAATDSNKLPTGALPKVAGTALDFRTPSKIDKYLRDATPLLGTPAGYDHSLVLNKDGGKFSLAGVITEEKSGRRMTVSTTEPSVQFNTGNGFDGSEIGSEGIPYQRHAGFAFETQHLPDSPNQSDFPTTKLNPGETFRSITHFEFSVLPDGKCDGNGA